jgi:hypothetical protein
MDYKQKKIVTKLNKVEKVELSLISDLNNFSDQMASASKNLSKYTTEVANIRLEYIRFMGKANGLYKKYGDDVVSEVEKDLLKYSRTAEKVALQAKELGIDPQKIKGVKGFLNNYESLEDSIDGLREYEQDLEQIIKSDVQL